MNSVDKILEERGNTHGSYKDIVESRSVIVYTLVEHYKLRHNTMPSFELITMWNDVALKLVRSAANPEHQDNWDDLAGYSKIIQELMEDKNNVSE